MKDPYRVRDADGSLWLRTSDGTYTVNTNGEWSRKWYGYTLEEIREDFGIISEGN